MKRGALELGGEDEDQDPTATAFATTPNKKRKVSNKTPAKQSLDPFDTAADSSPPSSPSPLPSDDDMQPDPPVLAAPKGPVKKGSKKKVVTPSNSDDEAVPALATPGGPGSGNPLGSKMKEEEDDDEENLYLEMGKSQTVDPERMQAILAKFTPEQMSRYECYRRSGFQKANMRRLLQSVAGCPVSMPMTIVMSGIAKMFVGDLVETGRVVMTERKESGPVRPCHIREAYRRLKLKGKVPQRTRPRLFH